MNLKKSMHGDVVEVARYADWMAPQVIDMIVGNYGRDADQFDEYFHSFYEHPFQRQRAIRLVALDGKRVCGFQSYFCWPYVRGGEPLASYQSGQSLVAEDYRGRGIFARLLNYPLEGVSGADVDFVVGFPAPMSFGSFLRNGWIHAADVVWYVKPLNPLSVILGREAGDAQLKFDRAPSFVDHAYSDSGFSLSKDREFLEWRQSYSNPDGPHRWFHFSEGSDVVRFELRAGRRGRANELIVGDVLTNSRDVRFMRSAFRELSRFARSHRHLGIMSIAINPDTIDSVVVEAVRKSGFFRVRGKKIPFIVRPTRTNFALDNAGDWHLLRSDMDTW